MDLEPTASTVAPGYLVKLEKDLVIKDFLLYMISGVNAKQKGGS